MGVVSSGAQRSGAAPEGRVTVSLAGGGRRGVLAFASMEAIKEHASAFDGLLREIRPLAEAFTRAGHRLYLVGGIVRDGLCGLERVDLDIDLTTDALPDEVEAIMRSQRPSALWLQGKRFGTIGARFPGPDGKDRAYEVTTHRSEAYEQGSRKPEVEYSSDIVADLSRRDFTVNAMAVDAMSPPGAAVLVDPFSGLADLRAGRLRTPLDPDVSFTDDPLRMLRAARFVSGHGLVADPPVLEAIRRLRDRLGIVSAERIRDEFSKLMLSERPIAGLVLLSDTSLLQVFASPLAGLMTDAVLLQRVGVVLERCPVELGVRLAALFALALGDDTRADEITHAWALELRYPVDECARVRSLLRLRAEFPSDDEPRAVRGFVRNAGHLLAAAQVLVSLTDDGDGRSLAVRDAINRLEKTEGLDMTPSLDGAAVMEHLGVGPGRDIGDALKMLAEVRLVAGPVGPDEERRRLDGWWAERQLRT